nr:Chain P, GLN-THR-ALA-GLY-ALA-ASN-SER-GLN-ARG-GLY-SER-ALA-GLY [Porphyromonas gingivalis W83]6SLN_Q Chain Q, GLN-THR-ALA-GLY-ALA-ASN-SER-GLN-ARG-GLY-SER-ALA-GLY [Porphyromonas gingivalis W83]
QTAGANSQRGSAG